ncbi:MAG: hypothetical protein PHQ75_11815, partial [Thermoguttaceae bacterium]|nr:hypothetical protein [Thermoguttaceae bacterium]
IYMILSLVRFIPCRFWNTPWRVNEANRTFVYSTSFSLIQLVKLEITIFWSFTSCYSSIMQAPPRVLLFLFPITLVATIVIVYVVTTIQCYQHRSY